MTESLARPALHHVNLKTTRQDEMAQWYGTVVGAEVVFRYDYGTWLTNDGANHRIALLQFPFFSDDPEKDPHTGLQHVAFEYASLGDLLDNYVRLRDLGVTPFMCFDHGMTMSLYYLDPDRNAVELQVDVFGDWSRSTEWMRTSPEFRHNPLGTFFDPERVLASHRDGMPFEEIHRRAHGGEWLPEPLPDVPMPEGPR